MKPAGMCGALFAMRAFIVRLGWKCLFAEDSPMLPEGLGFVCGQRLKQLEAAVNERRKSDATRLVLPTPPMPLRRLRPLLQLGENRA